MDDPTPNGSSPRSSAPRVASTITTRTTVLPSAGPAGGLPAGRDRFEQGRVLGRGGVGEVVLARDHDIDRPVAIKRILPDVDGDGVSGRFVEEIRVLGTLDHPNIVPIHDVSVDAEGRVFYVMKYVEGETLESVVEHLAAGDRDYHRRYTFERRREIFHDVLRAMQYAHSRGIIHRDIKPANVMVGRFGEVIVMDWGIALRLHDAPSRSPSGAPDTRTSEAASPRDRTLTGMLLGTPAYMSPEQARGENAAVDDRSDVYALCVMFHEMLTLRHYLADQTTVAGCITGVLEKEPVFPKAFHPLQGPVPVELVHFVRHGVAKDPAGRYRSVTAMLDRLQRIEEGHCPVECTVTLMKRVSTETSHAIDRRPYVVLAVALAAAMLLIGGVASIVGQVVP